MKTPLTIIPEFYNYAADISAPESEILQLLREETSKLPLGIMQISPLQAQFLALLIRITHSKKILEIGTFTGYSALAMAEALPEDGKIFTCDISEEWTTIAKKFWALAKLEHKISLYLNSALETLQHFKDTGHKNSFDLIFIDADKTNYLNYYELSLELIKDAGLIVIDNVLWDGKVIHPAQDAQTREIQRLNNFLKKDLRVSCTFLPIFDGLLLITKKEF